MARHKEILEGPARYSSRKAALLTSKQRLPWRQRAKRKTIKKSTAEKKTLAEQRLNRKIAYRQALADATETIHNEAIKLHEQFGGHSIEYYREQLMQHSRLGKKRRLVNGWNVFLRNEVKRMNDALPDGQPRKKVSELTSEISARWNAMSPEDRQEATADGKLELEGHREMKALATRNIPVEVFNDARQTLDNLEREIHTLHARTGVECLFIATRSKTDDFLRPYVVTTSNRPSQFFNLALGQSITDVAVRLEAYCISGARGVAQTYIQALLQLKSDTAALILRQLRITAQAHVPRMYYSNFDDSITSKWRVICEGWPLNKFCSPADLTTRTEVELLFNSWKNGTTRFCRLSDGEFENWENRRFQAALDETMGMDIDKDGDVGEDNDDNTGEDDQDIHLKELPRASEQHNDPRQNDHLPSDVQSLPPTTSAIVGSKRLSPERNSSVTSKKHKSTPLADSTAVNTLTSINGTPITIAKAPRKQRSDKGKKRGPHKKARV